MRIKHSEIVINPEPPFSNCKLERESYASILTSIVSTYMNGFVLAIDSEWGTGKSTFVKMWEQQLKNEGFKTLYFNAWENDFGTNPLAALISELQPLVNSQTNQRFKSLLEKGAIITKNTLPQILKVLASKYIDTQGIVDVIENTTKGVTEILETEVKDYVSKKEGLKDFRNCLLEFVQVTKNDRPIVFIVDELDRCRPTYAVEILEQIKHFFSVSGIVFILSIDKVQLGHAIRGVYGSDLINADEYIRRFIDIEYSLPQPRTKAFCNYLYDYFDFQTFFNSEKRKNLSPFRSDKDQLVSFSAILFQKANLTLRQQEKIFALARLGLNSFTFNQYIFPSLYLMLVFLKIFKRDYYQKVQQKRLSLDELLDGLYDLLPKGINEDEIRYFVYIEALLLFMYNNSISEHSYTSLFKRNEQTGKEEVVIHSRIDSAGDASFYNYLHSLSENWDIRGVKIEHLLNKVDLIENIVR